MARPYTWCVAGSANDRVSLDRDGDVWVGRFPGLGSVRVSPDGRIDVDVESEIDINSGHELDGAQSLVLSVDDFKEQALRFGWGEPLSLVRRGFVLAEGVAVVPAGSDGCILIHGDAHDTAIVALELALRSWTILADRVVPLEFGETGVLAHPRSAPLLAARRRAETTEFVSHSVRRETNVVAVEVARALQPCTVSALVSVRIRRPHEPVVDILTGHDRFDASRKTFLGGVLASIAGSPEDSLKRSLGLASLPSIAFHLDPQSPEADIDALVSWWDSL